MTIESIGLESTVKSYRRSKEWMGQIERGQKEIPRRNSVQIHLFRQFKMLTFLTKKDTHLSRVPGRGLSRVPGRGLPFMAEGTSTYVHVAALTSLVLFLCCRCFVAVGRA